jgi:hypothetical protein
MDYPFWGIIFVNWLEEKSGWNRPTMDVHRKLYKKV